MKIVIEAQNTLICKMASGGTVVYIAPTNFEKAKDLVAKYPNADSQRRMFKSNVQGGFSSSQWVKQSAKYDHVFLFLNGCWHYTSSKEKIFGVKVEGLS